MIISRQADKWLWPTRRVLVASSLVADSIPWTPEIDILHARDFVPSPARLAEVVVFLSKRGEPVYLLGDTGWPGWVEGNYADRFLEQLAASGLKATRIAATDRFELTEIGGIDCAEC